MLDDFNDPGERERTGLCLYMNREQISFMQWPRTPAVASTMRLVKMVCTQSVWTQIKMTCAPVTSWAGMLKRVDNSFYDIVDRAVAGNLEGGVAYRYGRCRKWSRDDLQ